MIDLNVGAIVLAAGSSRRFGIENKLHSLYQGTRVIDRVLNIVSNASFVETIAVISGDDASTRVTAQDKGFTVTQAIGIPGMGSSIAAGVRQLSAKLDGIAIFLGDLPQVSAELIGKILQRFEESNGQEIVRPICQDVPGHPVVFPISLKHQLESLAGDSGAQEIIRQNSRLLNWFETSDPAVKNDIDVPSDLR